MRDLLKRYFVANTARVLSVEYHRSITGWRFTPYRVGNAGGFYWGPWHVSWRMPYSDAWAFDGQRWVHAYTLTERNRHD
jgi:hypothetical protein